MDRLPVELVSIVVSYLEFENLLSYLAISQEFQFAIERCTFASIQLKSIDLEYFSKIITPLRWAALTTLNFSVIIPVYPLTRQLGHAGYR